MGGRRIRITAARVTCRLVRIIVSVRPILRAVVGWSVGVSGWSLSVSGWGVSVSGRSVGVMGTTAITLAAIVNGGLAGGGSAERYASRSSFSSPHALIWTGRPSEYGRGDPQPLQWAGFVVCSSRA